ncbi:hypothetical protein ALC57_10495, partial [Trachymyrmex cornetzi]
TDLCNKKDPFYSVYFRLFRWYSGVRRSSGSDLSNFNVAYSAAHKQHVQALLPSTRGLRCFFANPSGRHDHRVQLRYPLSNSSPIQSMRRLFIQLMVSFPHLEILCLEIYS